MFKDYFKKQLKNKLEKKIRSSHDVLVEIKNLLKDNSMPRTEKEERLASLREEHKALVRSKS